VVHRSASVIVASWAWRIERCWGPSIAVAHPAARLPPWAGLEHATSSVTPDATSKDEGGLHPLRRGLAGWLGDMRARVRLDPRRRAASVDSLTVASFPSIAGSHVVGRVVGSRLIVRGNDDAF
jgi:hypothetical protein